MVFLICFITAQSTSMLDCFKS